jgi:hypothetical protein
VAAFNYLTGETVASDSVSSDMSLIDYAQGYFPVAGELLMKGASDGYIRFSALKDKLVIEPPDDVRRGRRPTAQARRPNRHPAAIAARCPVRKRTARTVRRGTEESAKAARTAWEQAKRAETRRIRKMKTPALQESRRSGIFRFMT